MKDWTETLVSPGTTIRDTIGTIDASALQIALVVDGERRLKGTVTDGDVRRGILGGVSLDDPVTRIMNAQPTFVHQQDGRENVLALMRSKGLHQVPIVDDAHRVVGLQVVDDLIRPERRPNTVVIMAGGLGTRLRPLTDDCPKPLLRVGSKPILETILANFTEYGFDRFYFSVNYKADMIEEYFGDGSAWGVDIRYLREEKRLGTAGALSLLPERPTEPLVVMNGDLLTKLNFKHLLDFHCEHRASATMCVREHDVQVPYGVATTDGQRIVSLEEKPVYRFFVNAGIYVLQPGVLDYVAAETYLDMPELFGRVMKERHDAVVFPIREYWVDIGRMDDFERVNGEYKQFF